MTAEYYVLWSPSDETVRLHAIGTNPKKVLAIAKLFNLNAATFWLSTVPSNAFCIDWLAQSSLRSRVKKDVMGKPFLQEAAV